MTYEVKEVVMAHEVALAKRFLEYWVMEPGFADHFWEKPQEELKRIRLEELKGYLTELRMLVDPGEAIRATRMSDEERPALVKAYRAFQNGKLAERNDLKYVDCVPTEPRFKAWRTRQESRCWAELGAHNDGIIHTPLIFELSLGCSVGCPFCGVAAKKLQGVFRATEDNLALWRGILETTLDLMGPAAGTGTLYYASEPLDNPDYEKFAFMYDEIMGRVPQLTTATSMRRPERTRAYLQATAARQFIHRFSVLSLDMMHRIMDFFTPDELLRVELLPQFVEAPTANFSRAGRARDMDSDKVMKGDTGTIACVSGFVVNMVERSVRLITPCTACEKYPTGELILAKESFTDAASLREVLEGLIARFMREDFPKDEVLRLRNGIGFDKTEEGILFYRDSGFKLKFDGNDDLPKKYYHLLCDAINEGGKSSYDIAGDLYEKYDIMPAQIFFMLKKFIDAGLFLEHYE